MRSKLRCLTLTGICYVFLGISLLTLSSCGMFGRSSYNGYSESQSFDGAVSSTNGGYLNISKSSNSSMDYSNAYINSDLADYSYSFSANGKVKSKNALLKEYDKIQDFVKNNNGYISNVSNNYYGVETPFSEDQPDFENITKTGRGYLSFKIEIPKENAEETVKQLEQLTKNQNLTVTSYRQYITNYEGVQIVDDSDIEDYYYNYNRPYTQSEIDRILKYATISVSLNYQVPRNTFVSIFYFIVTFIKYALQIGFYAVIVLGITLIVSLLAIFIVVKPVYKLLHKSYFNYRITHADYFLPKEISINSNESVQDIIAARKNKYIKPRKPVFKKKSEE